MQKSANEILAMTATANDPAKRGRRACQPATFGELSRYQVTALHTRFGAVEWFVWDCQQEDGQTGLAKVIRQAPTVAQAVEGLLA